MDRYVAPRGHIKLTETTVADSHVAPPGYITLIPGQPVFAFSSYCCVFSGEATDTNFTVFGLTQWELEPTIYCTRGKHANQYTTDTVQYPGRHMFSFVNFTMIYIVNCFLFIVISKPTRKCSQNPPPTEFIKLKQIPGRKYRIAIQFSMLVVN